MSSDPILDLFSTSQSILDQCFWNLDQQSNQAKEFDDDFIKHYSLSLNCIDKFFSIDSFDQKKDSRQLITNPEEEDKFPQKSNNVDQFLSQIGYNNDTLEGDSGSMINEKFVQLQDDNQMDIFFDNQPLKMVKRGIFEEKSQFTVSDTQNQCPKVNDQLDNNQQKEYIYQQQSFGKEKISRPELQPMQPISIPFHQGLKQNRPDVPLFEIQESLNQENQENQQFQANLLQKFESLGLEDDKSIKKNVLFSKQPSLRKSLVEEFDEVAIKSHDYGNTEKSSQHNVIQVSNPETKSMGISQSSILNNHKGCTNEGVSVINKINSNSSYEDQGATTIGNDQKGEDDDEDLEELISQVQIQNNSVQTKSMNNISQDFEGNKHYKNEVFLDQQFYQQNLKAKNNQAGQEKSSFHYANQNLKQNHISKTLSDEIHSILYSKKLHENTFDIQSDEFEDALSQTASYLSLENNQKNFPDIKLVSSLSSSRQNTQQFSQVNDENSEYDLTDYSDNSSSNNGSYIFQEIEENDIKTSKDFQFFNNQHLCQGNVDEKIHNDQPKMFQLFNNFHLSANQDSAKISEPPQSDNMNMHQEKEANHQQEEDINKIIPGEHILSQTLSADLFLNEGQCNSSTPNLEPQNQNSNTQTSVYRDYLYYLKNQQQNQQNQGHQNQMPCRIVSSNKSPKKPQQNKVKKLYCNNKKVPDWASNIQQVKSISENQKKIMNPYAIFGKFEVDNLNLQDILSSQNHRIMRPRGSSANWRHEFTNNNSPNNG